MSLKIDFMNLNRPSKNGMETTICIKHYNDAAKWDWVMIRYPVDILDTRETEVVHAFTNLRSRGSFTWADALAWTRQYLTDHPDDGFSFA